MFGLSPLEALLGDIPWLLDPMTFPVLSGLLTTQLGLTIKVGADVSGFVCLRVELLEAAFRFLEELELLRRALTNGGLESVGGAARGREQGRRAGVGDVGILVTPSKSTVERSSGRSLHATYNKLSTTFVTAVQW